MTKCGCFHRANLVIFLYSVLDNFSYFRGIWFLFNVNNHHDTCIRGLFQNAIWFIWKDNLGRFQHHDLLPLDMKKEQLLQDTPPLNTAICFECPQCYCNGCHKNLSALLYNNLAMTSLYWCPPSSLCLYILVVYRCSLDTSLYKEVQVLRASRQ